MMRAMPVSHDEAARGAQRRRGVAPRALRASAGSSAAAARSACACGGSCPRCQAGAPLIQRQALPDSESTSFGDAGVSQPAEPSQSDPDESGGQMCGAGNIGGQIHMCCFNGADQDDPCWKVRVDTDEACMARNRENPRRYELCLSEQNFAMCRCLGSPRCKCGGIV